MTAVRVHKLDAWGRPVWFYDGVVLARDARMMQLEAFFGRDDIHTRYHTFKRDDRMVEWFYTDRWYNVFEMYDRDDGALTGWYCNITRPARFEADAIYADDLALDVMVYPDGRLVVLDEDEFTALGLDGETVKKARAALADLLNRVERREEMFSKIKPNAAHPIGTLPE